MDASPPLYAVVPLSPGLPPHELLLRRQTGCTRGPSDPEPQRGTVRPHQGAQDSSLCRYLLFWEKRQVKFVCDGSWKSVFDLQLNTYSFSLALKHE